jgi:hypothetical protein
MYRVEFLVFHARYCSCFYFTVPIRSIVGVECVVCHVRAICCQTYCLSPRHPLAVVVPRCNPKFPITLSGFLHPVFIASYKKYISLGIS